MIAWSRGLALMLALAGSLALMPQARAANLATDGGFEALRPGAGTMPHLCDNSQDTNTCTSNFTNWLATCAPSGCGGTASPSSIIINGIGDGWNSNSTQTSAFGFRGASTYSPNGGNFVALDGDPAYRDSVYQTISGLVIGATYQISFYQAGAQQAGSSGPTTDRLQVDFGLEDGVASQLSTLINNDDPGPTTPWTLETMYFVAANTSQVLRFIGVGTPGGQPPITLLDGISVQQVPEPASLVLVGSGVIALLGFSRRRVRRGMKG